MTTPFKRDAFTWTAYFMLSYYAYMQATLGPSIPFLRGELDFNYTVSAFYITAFALGMIGAGLTADRAVRRFGRAFLFWGGGAGMAVGAVLLTLGRTTEFTIITTFVMAFLGTYIAIMVQATISDQHGEKRAYALTEMNVFAVLAASAAPLLVGFGQAQGLSWRLAPISGIAVWALVFIWMRRRVILPPAPDFPPNDSAGKRDSKLPRVFWAYWLIVFTSVAIEWCMIFWASTYMETVVGLGKEAAATSVSLFTLAQMVGRAAGSGLTRRYPTGRLLLAAGGIVLIGFPLYWLGRTPLVNTLGLFICGLGVANLFPLTLSAASAVSVANQNAASARISVGAGLAILVAPQILGTAADQIGIFNAYGMVVPLVIAVIGITWYANRMTGTLPLSSEQ